MAKEINLNADMGEGFGAYDIGDDSGLLKIIRSASIACGFQLNSRVLEAADWDRSASRALCR